MCNHCNFQKDENTIYDGGYKPIHLIDGEGDSLTANVLMQCNLDGVYLVLTAWDTDSTAKSIYKRVKINHCPFCGRRFNVGETENE